MKYYIKVIENKNVVTKKHTENIKNNGKYAVLYMASLSQRYNISVRKRDIRENSTALKKLKNLIYKTFSHTIFCKQKPKEHAKCSCRSLGEQGNINTKNMVSNSFPYKICTLEVHL